MFTALENLAIAGAGKRIGTRDLHTSGDGDAGFYQAVIVEHIRCRAGNMQGKIVSRIQRLAGAASGEENKLVTNYLFDTILRLRKTDRREFGNRAPGLRVKRSHLATGQAKAECEA
jgi:hypothetical protein